MVAKAGTRSKSTVTSDSRQSAKAGAQDSTQDERLYNEVLDAILDHRLSPGIKLKEDELANIFSVSRTVVRKALLKLAHDRIVDIQPNRGASIFRPDVNKAKEILGVRRLIEGELIREATLRATADSLSDLRLCIDQERDHMHRKKIGSGLRLSGDFHIRLSMLSSNATLQSYLKELVPQTSLIIAMYQRPQHQMCSHQEHFDIVDVIATGDVRAAQAEMDNHLRRIEDKLDLGPGREQGDLHTAFAHVSQLTC